MANEALLELRKLVDKSTQKDVAKLLGFSAPFICDVLKGRRDMTSSLAGSLGYVMVTKYVKVKL